MHIAGKTSLALLMVLLAGTCRAAVDYGATINVFKEAKEVQPFFKNAYGYAVFPTIGKGGLGLGFAHGNGQVYRGGVVTGNTSMTQVSIGLQAGGQAYSQIIFFQDKRAYEEFTSGNFEFGAQATAVAITAGAQAQASTAGSSASANKKQSSAEYHGGMAIFVHAKGGLMYEASVSGQKYNFKPATAPTRSK